MVSTIKNKEAEAISPFGPARSTVSGQPLSSEELKQMDSYWKACCYLAAGMIYLRANPLLKEPLKLEHTKKR